MPVDFMTAYWIPNRPTLLPIAQIDFTAAQLVTSSVRASAMLSTAEKNISPAQT